MDEIDQQILKELTRDVQLPFSGIAKNRRFTENCANKI